MEVHFILMIVKMTRDEKGSKGAENIRGTVFDYNPRNPDEL